MTTTNSYTGQLGAFLTPHGDTCFRVWSPDATTADLLIENHTVNMHPIGAGVWEAKLEGDRHGQCYSYRLSLRGETIESVDPICSGGDGERNTWGRRHAIHPCAPHAGL
ncbi:Pullulanase precursor [Corynebacterium belfantii]|nr:Pullulanase precursor [Corynebacterium belfantii]